MSVGTNRSPVRPLGSTNSSKAYPGEILVNEANGDLSYVKSNGAVTPQTFDVEKLRGAFTVDYNSTTNTINFN